MNKLIAVIGVVILALIGVVGDFFIDLAGKGKSFITIKWFVIGFIIYALTAFGWFFVMKNIKLSTLGVFYAISTIVFLFIVGTLYFKESVNIYEIVGIILAITSIFLLYKFT